jgi:hypothetical protein
MTHVSTLSVVGGVFGSGWKYHKTLISYHFVFIALSLRLILPFPVTRSFDKELSNMHVLHLLPSFLHLLLFASDSKQIVALLNVFPHSRKSTKN